MSEEGNSNNNIADEEANTNDTMGYHAFQYGQNNRQAKGILYKLNPMKNDLKAKVTEYVHNGAMENDLRYAREVFGLTNTSGRKEFISFWESPWVEEHVRDTSKKRKIEAQQRSMAVRSYIKASSTQDAENVDKFLETVDKLTEWEDQYDSKDDVKTVSRLIQSFERVAIRNVINTLESAICLSYRNVKSHLARLQHDNDDDIGKIAHALRRADAVYDLFAGTVAAEISWADCTNGSRNTSIYLCRQLKEKKDVATMNLIRRLNSLDDTQLKIDHIGLPLMQANSKMCVAKGVLVVFPGSTEASYVLDIVGGGDDLFNVKNIVIAQHFSSENEDDIKSGPKKQKGVLNMNSSDKINHKKKFEHENNKNKNQTNSEYSSELSSLMNE